MSIRVLVNEDDERIGEVVVRGLPPLFFVPRVSSQGTRPQLISTG